MIVLHNLAVFGADGREPKTPLLSFTISQDLVLGTTSESHRYATNITEDRKTYLKLVKNAGKSNLSC